MVFKKGIRNIQAAAYNVTRTMLGLSNDISFVSTISMAADIIGKILENQLLSN